MKKALLAASVVALSVGGLAPVGLTAAGADPVDTAFASGYGANIDVAGVTAVDQGGLATATVPPGQDAGPNSVALVPAAPVAVSATAVVVKPLAPRCTSVAVAASSSACRVVARRSACVDINAQ